eukprot:2472850-Rhodomonas_salina.2
MEEDGREGDQSWRRPRSRHEGPRRRSWSPCRRARATRQSRSCTRGGGRRGLGCEGGRRTVERWGGEVHRGTRVWEDDGLSSCHPVCGRSNGTVRRHHVGTRRTWRRGTRTRWSGPSSCFRIPAPANAHAPSAPKQRSAETGHDRVRVAAPKHSACSRIQNAGQRRARR